MIDTIAFDADDTLWHNESLFTLSQARFIELIAPFHERTDVEQRLFETEVRNLRHFGYGVKGFTLSMIETALELTEGRIDGAAIGLMIDLAKAMLAAPVELLPHVTDTVKYLSEQGFRLLVITKGDLFDQESKVARSGLAERFSTVEVVSEKNPESYTRLCQRNGIDPGKLLMVGNSLKSDILPVLTIGGYAAHIPYHTTWAHEQVIGDLPVGPRFVQLGELSEVLGHLDTWQHGISNNALPTGTDRREN
jgi:putative hydrolase of the HAD superfamily